MSYHPGRLETTLHHRLGDALRSFWTYTPSGNYTLTYVKPDLDKEIVEYRVKRVVEIYRDEHLLTREEDDDVLSSLQGAVHLFDNVFAMHFAHPEANHGVGFSMDPTVGRSLNDFLDECVVTLIGE